LDYSFNNSEEGWKYEEQEKALVFANQLKNIGQSNLETLNYMLTAIFKQHITYDKLLPKTFINFYNYLFLQFWI